MWIRKTEKMKKKLIFSFIIRMNNNNTQTQYLLPTDLENIIYNFKQQLHFSDVLVEMKTHNNECVECNIHKCDLHWIKCNGCGEEICNHCEKGLENNKDGAPEKDVCNRCYNSYLIFYEIESLLEREVTRIEIKKLAIVFLEIDYVWQLKNLLDLVSRFNQNPNENLETFDEIIEEIQDIIMDDDDEEIIFI